MAEKSLVNDLTDSDGTPPPDDEVVGDVEPLLSEPPQAVAVRAPAASTATNANFLVSKVLPLNDMDAAPWHGPTRADQARVCYVTDFLVKRST